jgi:hypothetical protein
MWHPSTGHAEDLLGLRARWNGQFNFTGHRLDFSLPPQDRSEDVYLGSRVQVVAFPFEVFILFYLNDKVQVQAVWARACHPDFRTSTHTRRNFNLLAFAFSLDLQG